MDEIAKRQHDILHTVGPKTIPGHVRDQQFTREQVRAQTAGGSDSQRLRDTLAYQEACNALHVPGSDFFIALDAARAGEVPALKGKGENLVAARERELKGKGQIKGKD